MCGGLSGKEDCCHCLKLRNTTTTTTATTTFEPTTIIQSVTGTTTSSVDGGGEEELSTMTTEPFPATVKTTLTTNAVSTNTATTKANTESPELNTCEDTGCTGHFGGQGR